ncbi:MAG: hypothetical protein DRP01_02260 [Archaeoglobales archaeon]|nr:MAG: hypothetical protein DRP01_02260 [Archaeoglobales archaeon]
MTRYGIITSYATSLTVVGRDIAYTINKLGHQAVFHDYQVQWYDAKKEFDRGIIFIPFDPLYAPSWFLLQRDYNLHGIPSVTYVTTEGEPKKWLVRDWIRRDCTFIANSRFTERMLRRIDVDVIDIIYHGVNFDMINQINPPKQQLKQELDAKVVFGTVASELPRKGLSHLAQAIRMISNKLPDAKFYVLTTPRGTAHFIGLENVHVSPEFGHLTREEVLSLIGSFDYYICSSLAEGFGLPVLEAQAFGIPVIYPYYDPLNEIAHPTANFPVKIIGEEYQSQDQGILFLLHRYKPEDMAEQIEKAYEIYTTSPDEYQKLSQQVKEFSQQFDIMKTYSKFVKE